MGAISVCFLFGILAVVAAYPHRLQSDTPLSFHKLTISGPNDIQIHYGALLGYCRDINDVNIPTNLTVHYNHTGAFRLETFSKRCSELVREEPIAKSVENGVTIEINRRRPICSFALEHAHDPEMPVTVKFPGFNVTTSGTDCVQLECSYPTRLEMHVNNQATNAMISLYSGENCTQPEFRNSQHGADLVTSTRVDLTIVRSFRIVFEK